MDVPSVHLPVRRSMGFNVCLLAHRHRGIGRFVRRPQTGSELDFPIRTPVDRVPDGSALNGNTFEAPTHFHSAWKGELPGLRGLLLIRDPGLCRGPDLVYHRPSPSGHVAIQTENSVPIEM